MINLENFIERYPGNNLEFTNLAFAPTLEHSEVDGSWGSALSLSIEETLKYCQTRKGSFIPSAGLLFSIFGRLHQKGEITEEEAQFLGEIDNYWHRTASLLVFPTKDKQGYTLHYPRLGDDTLVRDNDGTIAGKIKLNISKDEFPPYGEVARIRNHPDFFKKVLGLDYLQEYDNGFKEKLGGDVCVWIPPEKCIIKAPEKLIVFGAFAQYGMGLWLTSYTGDKTLSGGRPFRLAYNFQKSN